MELCTTAVKGHNVMYSVNFIYACVWKNVLFDIQLFWNECIKLPMENLYVFKNEEDSINGIYFWVSWQNNAILD
jgi:hypothetical protein